ncbi:hypothetical protein UFOVP53_56 [uncultured Caudovirales phage]|uniref:Uncharacterized protein n=1 Tax=uncultured Caudovirales phage TaxID=2100421 RepID=A0A6J5KV79_9CAUD|nr:hypothetical protein UFOVP53_56 [uncultured Caudovirales phage]
MASTNKIRKQFTMSIVDCAQALQSLHVVGTVITDDISAAWVEVGQGNIVRVVLTADTYFAFSDDDAAAAVTVSTSPAVKLGSGESYIITSAKYIRASVNPSRVELLDV